MKILVNEKISQHKYKTPEGYLICVDSVLARTGNQTYRKNELFVDSEDDSEIEVGRSPEEVFSPETLASFENKPITVEHPDEDVNIENYKDYSVGFVRDVKQGKFDGQDVILGTLVITDKDAIEGIENGEHVELSCGYDCDIEDGADGYQQKHIRGNHVALCEAGRAGIAKIIDSVEDAAGPEAKGQYKGYEVVAKHVEYKNAPTEVDIFDGKRKVKSYFTIEEDLDKAVREVNKFWPEPPLTKENRKYIENYLSMISGFVRRKDTDIQDVLRPLNGKGFKPVVEKIEGWIWKKDAYAYKNYYISLDGYKDTFLVTLYADPNQDWDTKEVNAYFTDSVKDEKLYTVAYNASITANGVKTKEFDDYNSALSFAKKMYRNPKNHTVIVYEGDPYNGKEIWKQSKLGAGDSVKDRGPNVFEVRWYINGKSNPNAMTFDTYDEAKEFCIKNLLKDRRVREIWIESGSHTLNHWNGYGWSFNDDSGEDDGEKNFEIVYLDNNDAKCTQTVPAKTAKEAERKLKEVLPVYRILSVKPTKDSTPDEEQTEELEEDYDNFVEDAQIDVPENLINEFERRLKDAHIKIVKKEKSSSSGYSYEYAVESYQKSFAADLKKIAKWFDDQDYLMSYSTKHNGRYDADTGKIILHKRITGDSMKDAKEVRYQGYIIQEYHPLHDDPEGDGYIISKNGIIVGGADSIDEAIKKINRKELKRDSINDVDPRSGESKDDFIARFMKETKNEYPDEKQRLAVAYSYWERKGKDSISDSRINDLYLNGKVSNSDLQNLVDKLTKKYLKSPMANEYGSINIKTGDPIFLQVQITFYMYAERSWRPSKGKDLSELDSFKWTVTVYGKGSYIKAGMYPNRDKEWTSTSIKEATSQISEVAKYANELYDGIVKGKKDSLGDAKELSATSVDYLDEMIERYRRKHPQAEFGEIEKRKDYYVVKILKDSMQEVPDKLVKEFERQLSRFGVQIKAKGKTWTGSKHYQVEYYGGMGDFQRILEKLNTWCESQKIPFTYNYTDNGRGGYDAGIDLHRISVPDSKLKDDKASNFKRDVVNWWKEVERWNNEAQMFNIENDYRDIEGLFIAIPDIIWDRQFEKAQPALAKVGERLYKRWKYDYHLLVDSMTEDSMVKDTTIEAGKTYNCASGAKVKVKKVRSDISDYNGEAFLWIWYDWTSASGKKSGSSDCSGYSFFRMLTDKNLTGDCKPKDSIYTISVQGQKSKKLVRAKDAREAIDKYTKMFPKDKIKSVKKTDKFNNIFDIIGR